MAKISRYDEWDMVVAAIKSCAKKKPFSLEDVRAASNGVIAGKVREYVKLLSETAYLLPVQSKDKNQRYVLAKPDEISSTTFEHCTGVLNEKRRKHTEVHEHITENLDVITFDLNEQEPTEKEIPMTLDTFLDFLSQMIQKTKEANLFENQVMELTTELTACKEQKDKIELESLTDKEELERLRKKIRALVEE